MTWLERAAALHPDRTAVVAPEGELTYAELLAAARATPVTGTSVSLAAPSLGFVVDLHAALLHGVPLLPVDARWTEEERATRLAVAPEHPGAALILFTSGSTGAPKAVALTPANLLASALGSAAALGLDPAERWLSALPLSHVGGLSVLVRSAIYATTAVLQDRFDADGHQTGADRGRHHTRLARADHALAPARRGSHAAAGAALGPARRRAGRSCPARARRGGRGPGPRDLRDDRGRLADRHRRPADPGCHGRARARRGDRRLRSDGRGRRPAAHGGPRTTRRARAPARDRPQGRHDRHGRRERRARRRSRRR